MPTRAKTESSPLARLTCLPDLIPVFSLWGDCKAFEGKTRKIFVFAFIQGVSRPRRMPGICKKATSGHSGSGRARKDVMVAVSEERQICQDTFLAVL